MYGITRRFNEIEAPVKRYIHCGATPLVAYVLPTGQVSICTLVRDETFNPKVNDPFVGNIHEENFFDMWGSQKHRELIAGLSKSNCHRCHFAVYNQVLELVSSDQMHRKFL